MLYAILSHENTSPNRPRVTICNCKYVASEDKGFENDFIYSNNVSLKQFFMISVYFSEKNL